MICHDLGQPHDVTENQAGLARVALAEGDHTEARAHVEAILAYRAEHSTFDSTDEPFRIALTCYEVLHATNDPRAAGILTMAHATLQAHAATITDPALHHAFLEHVPYHRAIMAAWAGAYARSLYDAHDPTAADRQ